MAKKEVKHDPAHVAHVAAGLLGGRHDAELHHIKAAVATARSILDEAYGVEPEEGAEEPEAAETEET